MPKYLVSISSLLLTLGLVFPASQAFASGPIGQNSLRTEAGPGIGQVTLNWTRYYSQVDNYSISYGTQSGKYLYTTGNLGNVAVDTIGGLNPGQKYYFFLFPSSQGQSLAPVSGEISEVAAAVPHTVVGTSGPYGTRGLTAIAGPSRGQITLTWTQTNPSTTGYNLVYGTQPGKYQFGAINLGNAGLGVKSTFTVGFLIPGQRYYFALIPIRGGTSAYDSSEVSQVAHK